MLLIAANVLAVRDGTPPCVPAKLRMSDNSFHEKAGLHGMRYAPNDQRARGARERRPAVKKISTVATNRNEIFKEPQLTIGLDWETEQAITAFWMRQVT